MSVIAARFAALTTGLTAEKIALIIAIGFVLGTFPVLGCPTILCAAAALALRLNLPALQVVNQIATPVQLALLLPFARIGAHVAGSRTGLAGVLVHALTGWCCVCVPLGVVLYFTLVFLMRKWLGHQIIALETAG